MVRKNVAEILSNHVTFELEAIDRMYLNAYVPSLQTGGGFVYFVKTQLQARVPSTMMVAPMSQQFVAAIGGTSGQWLPARRSRDRGGSQRRFCVP